MTLPRFDCEWRSDRGAVFSDDRAYRYALWRWWSRAPVDGKFVLFIGLNPSTADETEDDPTIRRCMRFARDWGYDGVVMANLFALRATDPRVMKAHPAPVGPYNDYALVDLAGRAGIIVAAWGVHGDHRDRSTGVCGLLKTCSLHCLGTTQAGHPRHPLYLPANSRPLPFTSGNQ